MKWLIILIMLVPLLNHEDQESSPPTRWNPAHKFFSKKHTRMHHEERKFFDAWQVVGSFIEHIAKHVN